MYDLHVSPICGFAFQVSNTEGELYCLSVRSRHFRWIQDFSYLDKVFTVTPGNNGFLYVTVPLKALVLALDVSSGNVLWQRSVGPLSRLNTAPVVDSNGNSFSTKLTFCSFKMYFGDGLIPEDGDSLL